MDKSFGNGFRQTYVEFEATQKSNYCFNSYLFTSVLFFLGGGGGRRDEKIFFLDISYMHHNN